MSTHDGHRQRVRERFFNFTRRARSHQKTLPGLQKLGDALVHAVHAVRQMRPRRDEDGITYMGIRDFLLDEASLDL